MSLSDNKRPKVLIADDEEDIRQLVEVNLVKDYDVIGAADGRECLEKARSEAPDLILLDIMMPTMNGRDVLVHLSEDAATRHIPVIFLSALTRPEDRVTGLDSGAVDYIAKPADPRELVARVAAALRNRPPAPADESSLPDREAFTSRLSEEVARSLRHHSPVSVLLLEIDDFTEIEPRPDGQSVLEKVSGALHSTLRLSDVLFRYGEGAFAAVLPDTNSATAFLAAERCRLAVAGSMDRTVTVSIGIAEAGRGRSGEDLVAKAEVALFRAKDSGGNRCWRSDDPRRRGLSPRSLSEELTEREWDVLAHLVKRRTEPEIARHLGISAGTVRSHKARIRRKLQVEPNTKLSDYAQANLKDLIEHLNRTSA